jgi:hypothetical protein
MLRTRPLSALLLVAPLAALALAPPSDAGAASPDPAARGLDLFVEVPQRSAPGAKVPVQVEALGFPTAVTLAPLAGAQIEAVWDPESLGPGVSQAPPAVRATTDAAGRAHLDVPVPEGGERSLRLLLGTTHGDHHRTTEVSVHRIVARDLSLIVPDSHVVPGGATSAWVIVRDTGTGQPAAGEAITFELLEGGVARFTKEATTDSAGTAMARMPIPWTDEPTFSWKLVARSHAAQIEGTEVGTAAVILSPREETPGEPQLTADWAEKHAQPGDRVAFTLRLRDASDRPVAGAAVRYWIGPKGTDPPSIAVDPKGWERASTLATTDVAGEVTGVADAPKTLRKGASSNLRIVAHAELFGHGLSAEKAVEVSTPLPRVAAFPEVGQLVPGLEQVIVVSVRDSRDRPVAGTFVVEADGLSQRVTTDAWGEAEATWRVPLDVGASRNVGPCAGGVAATVTVRPVDKLPVLDNRTDAFSTCVAVNRDLAGMMRVDKPMAVAGSALHVRVLEAPEEKAKGAKAAKPDKGAAAAWSVMASPVWLGGPRAASAWVEDAARGIDLPMPSATPGSWLLSASAPRTDAAARRAAGRVIVAPRVVPKLSAALAGGRAAPLGTVEIDVDLTDGKGKGAPGSIAAILVDAFGGGRVDGLVELDTRGSLCRTLGVEKAACDPFFDDPAADTLRRRVLSEQELGGWLPDRDPGGTAKQEMRDAFKSVLLSLEGAVMDATAAPDLLRDAFRKEKNGFTFNPELFTLVTAAMDPPPVTPGGEAIALGDLVAMDRQVTYDNVARRVTRLKLFRVLAAVRTYRKDRNLDPDEPVLRDPNAILRRMVQNGELQQQDLLDPWGGTMSFVKAPGQGLRMPFVNVRGFELHAPGPDGKIGTGDDVKSPFERVVASGTPYAQAMDEDRLVDAALDMEVSETTVSAWQQVLEELTGQTLGRGEGIGLGSIGTVGHGSGHGGVRAGRTSVSRQSGGISTGAAYWSPPQRTDDKGHLRLRVPLGDVETTWRLALVGAPDGATPAVTTIDIPSALPLSARVDAGAAWVAGDEADVIVTVRNRTAASAKVELSLAAGGPAQLVKPGDRSRAVDVPAGSASQVLVRVRAATSGTATLDVVAKGPGGLEDHTTHSWDVRPAGEVVDLTSTQWVDGHGALALSQVGPGLSAIGTAHLVLERGNARAIEAALEALDPDSLSSEDGLSYAMEAAARIQKWATARGGDADPLAQRAGDVVRRSVGRIVARRDARAHGPVWSAERRAVRWAPSDLVSALPKVDDCPPDASPGLTEGLATLEAEPSASEGVIQACWDNLVSSVVANVMASGDRAALARAVLALAERPQRAAVAASLADKLRAAVALRPSGGVTLPAGTQRDRASRALVFAALLRASSIGQPSAATPDKLAAWLRVQRDAQGSYGSALATLAAVRALVNGPAEATAPTKVTIVADELRKEVTVPAGGTIDVPLGAKAIRVEIDSEGPGVLARLLRPGLRSWDFPPDTSSSGIAFDVRWPDKAKAGAKDVVRVSASSKSGRAITADIRIPLPPGAALAEGGGAARQIQGQLVMRALLDSSGTETVVELPILFGLAGSFTVPEAIARPANEEGARALAAARPLKVR